MDDRARVEKGLDYRRQCYLEAEKSGQLRQVCA